MAPAQVRDGDRDTFACFSDVAVGQVEFQKLVEIKEGFKVITQVNSFSSGEQFHVVLTFTEPLPQHL